MPALGLHRLLHRPRRLPTLPFALRAHLEALRVLHIWRLAFARGRYAARLSEQGAMVRTKGWVGCHRCLRSRRPSVLLRGALLRSKPTAGCNWDVREARRGAGRDGPALPAAAGHPLHQVQVRLLVVGSIRPHQEAAPHQCDRLH